jgi:hypothetical protein
MHIICLLNAKRTVSAVSKLGGVNIVGKNSESNPSGSENRIIPVVRSVLATPSVYACRLLFRFSSAV